ncbi:MAG: DUF1214 domain-containing protein [Thiocapsa sp.]|nr:DUF1214 domain-containing protein [Thiocapsa sp.]MCG6984198.1 DUF1214 domain-containing protein [Thiocapsa sp.]
MTLPGPIPAKDFRSFTVYDSQTRPLLPTDQKLAGFDSTLAGMQMNKDDGVTVWFGPSAPLGSKDARRQCDRLRRSWRGFFWASPAEYGERQHLVCGSSSRSTRPCLPRSAPRSWRAGSAGGRTSESVKQPLTISSR